jgi:hypothetical protein
LGPVGDDDVGVVLLPNWFVYKFFQLSQVNLVALLAQAWQSLYSGRYL